MDKSTTLNLRVNPNVKQCAEAVLSKLGIPMSVAIDMYLNQISLTGGIPFPVTLPQAPAKVNADLMTDDELKAKLQQENKITIETIRNAVLNIVDSYPIKSVILFGSRAAGTNRDDSDVDLIIEFTEPVTLLTLSDIKFCLEDILGISVDIVHGPIRETDMIEIGKETELYAA